MILHEEDIGDGATRTARMGLPAVDCSPSEPHEEPSQERVFGLLTVFVPVFDRYAMAASSEEVVLSWYWTNTPSSEEMSVGKVPDTLVPSVIVSVEGALVACSTSWSAFGRFVAPMTTTLPRA